VLPVPCLHSSFKCQIKRTRLLSKAGCSTVPSSVLVPSEVPCPVFGFALRPGEAALPPTVCLLPCPVLLPVPVPKPDRPNSGFHSAEIGRASCRERGKSKQRRG